VGAPRSPAAPREPTLSRPVPAIDPHQRPRACMDMFAILYHAEKAAMEAFDRLGDPRIVENCQIFIQAQPLLVAQEEAHVRDIEEIIRALGGYEIPAAPPGFVDLWSLEHSRRKLVFPLRARVAALYTLIAESLGYAYLYVLTDAIGGRDQAIAARLQANVDDEKNHIQVSMAVLREALAPASKLASLELALHLPAFLLLSRKAARTMLVSLGEVGFDPYVVAGSSLAFTCGLLQDVVQETSGRSAGFHVLRMVSHVIASPRCLRVFAMAIHLPEPPLFWPAFRAALRLIQRFETAR
jgi:hypothetical protein